MQVSVFSQPTQQTLNFSARLFRENGPSMRTPVAVRPSATPPADRRGRDTMSLILNPSAIGPV